MIKKLAILNKEQWLNILCFALLCVFYAIVPYTVFLETYGGITHTSSKVSISLGMCIGVIIILIVVKRMWVNTKTSVLHARIGVLTDNYKTETDQLKKRRLAFRLALLKMCITILNMIVPIVCVGAVVLVTSLMQNSLEALVMFKKCILLSSISFFIGLIIQIAFPFIVAQSCSRESKGV